MEKYTAFRDRGSGIAPFMPHRTPVSAITAVPNTFLFLFRLPFFLFFALLYFGLLAHVPQPVFMRKLALWTLLGIPGIWWVDLQLDGVKRGHLHAQPPSRVPGNGSIIAASFTSPIDSLYLAAIFDPVFVACYPGTTKVQRISLLSAILRALAPVTQHPPDASGAKLTTLRALMEEHPNRPVAVFPEAGTTNGKAVLPLTPGLASAPPKAPVFAISLRYTPQDVTTPVPGTYFSFLWKLLSRPTHCIRVRISEPIQLGVVASTSDSTSTSTLPSASKLASRNGKPNLREGWHEKPGDAGSDEALTSDQQQGLDRVADTLSRLARNKRVGLTLRDKAAFVEAWKRRK